MANLEPSKEKKPAIWPFLVFTLVGLAAIYYFYRPASGLRGNVAPDFTLKERGGSSVKLSALKGKVVLLNFWAPWCGPCIEEMPALAELEKSLEGKPFVLYAVNVDGESKDMYADFRADRAPKHLVSEIPEAVADAYDVRVLPTTVLIDREGVVRDIFWGPRDWNSPSVRTKIDPLL